MAKSDAFHERLLHHEVKRGSDRSFGLVFAGFFAILFALGLWRGSELLWLWASLSGAFLLVALAAPRVLAPLNRLWYLFGLLLGRVVNPVVMFAVFAIAVTPTALILRALGKDPLRLKWDGAAKSYWIPREPPGPAPESMKHQF
jgi:hypothetical protein